ncbi:MAG: hypothetical protein IID40_06320 [Planctomycetes bacterium]|nr:hypothetical protein [Planctomycetota bacterium]
MPRPSKQIRRQKVAAGVEWKKGNRDEAAKLWAEADKARKEIQAKKKKNQKKGTGDSASAEQAKTSST